MGNCLQVRCSHDILSRSDECLALGFVVRRRAQTQPDGLPATISCGQDSGAISLIGCSVAETASSDDGQEIRLEHGNTCDRMGLAGRRPPQTWMKVRLVLGCRLVLFGKEETDDKQGISALTCVSLQLVVWCVELFRVRSGPFYSAISPILSVA
jgi:hypothetical protein